MNPLDIINEFYKPGSKLHAVFMQHSENVAGKALKTAEKMAHLNPDLQFIHEAAMLHDIGIFMTNSPSLGCYGDHIYVCHGILGRAVLEQRGLHRHGLVCERHVGTGITVEDIKNTRLPLPLRDMRPVSIEEKIIAYADKFYSKSPGSGNQEKTIEQIIQGLEKYGQDKVDVFNSWVKIFEENSD